MKQATKALYLGLVAGVCIFFTKTRTYADTIYVSNSSGGTIMKFDSSGNGTVFPSGLNEPEGLAFDTSGNLYVDGPYTSVIVKFNPNWNMSTFASGMNVPYGLTMDSSNNLYVSNFSNTAHGIGTIMKFDSSGNGTVFASGLNTPLRSNHGQQQQSLHDEWA